MITEEKWQEMKVAEKRDALRAETGELWMGIHRLEQHHRNFMRGGVDEMRSRYDALSASVIVMSIANTDLRKQVEDLQRSVERIWVKQRKLMGRMRKVEAMLGIASPSELIADG